MADDSAVQSPDAGLLGTGMDPQLLAQIQAYAAQAGPSKQDRHDALTNTLFQMAAGILGARDGNPWRAIGQGALPAIQNYPTQLKDIGQQRSQAILAGSQMMNSAQQQMMLQAKMPLLKAIAQQAQGLQVPQSGPQPFQTPGGANAGFMSSLNDGAAQPNQPAVNNLQPAGTQSPQNAYDSQAKLNWLLSAAGMGDHTAAFKAMHPTVGVDQRAGSLMDMPDGTTRFAPNLEKGMIPDGKGGVITMPNFNASVANTAAAEAGGKAMMAPQMGIRNGAPAVVGSVYDSIMQGRTPPWATAAAGNAPAAAPAAPTQEQPAPQAPARAQASVVPQEGTADNVDHSSIASGSLATRPLPAPKSILNEVPSYQAKYIPGQTALSPEQQKYQDYLGEFQGNINTAASGASKQQAMLDEQSSALKVLAKNGVKTGPLLNSMAEGSGLAQQLGGFGVPGANWVANKLVTNPQETLPAIAVLGKIATVLTGSQLKEGYGSREAASIVNMVRDSYANAGQNPGTPEVLIKYMSGVNKWSQEAQQYMSAWVQKNGSAAGFPEWWNATHPVTAYVPPIGILQELSKGPTKQSPGNGASGSIQQSAPTATEIGLNVRAAQKAIAANPDARAAVIQRMKTNGYPTDAL